MYMYTYQYINGQQKQKTKVCFPWSANDTIAVSANVPIYGSCTLLLIF